jgi:hypothetical protein
MNIHAYKYLQKQNEIPMLKNLHRG